MKTLSRTFTVFLVLAFCQTGTSQTDYVGIVADFMKVEPENHSAYLEVEQAWKKLHQQRMEEGIITGWHLYRKRFGGADEPYQYITINFYDDFKKVERPFSQEAVDKLFTESEWDALVDKTLKSRALVNNEYYRVVLRGDETRPHKYLWVNRFKVDPQNFTAFMEAENELVLPLMNEYIKRGMQESWVLWQKWPYSNDFNYVTTDAFDEWGKWFETEWDIISEVHPGRTSEDLWGRQHEIRTFLSREVWELIDFVAPEP